MWSIFYCIIEIFTFKPLSDLLSSVSDEIKKIILCSAFVFSWTNSLKDDILVINLQEKSFDLVKLAQQLETNTETIVFSAQDLKFILFQLQIVKDSL
jgi:hypothetical protein